MNEDKTIRILMTCYPAGNSEALQAVMKAGESRILSGTKERDSSLWHTSKYTFLAEWMQLCCFS
jgi:hypothetical protein